MPNVIRKSAGRVFEVGELVSINGRGPAYRIAAVEFETRGESRFDFYRLASLAGAPLDRRFVRAELRATPTHLLPTSCYVCGSTERHEPSSHVFITNAAAHAARGPLSASYPDGTTDAAAHYVNTHRPY